MIKCGVLTFQMTTNYGAVLQAYALMHALNNFDAVNCEILDYRCEAVEDRYKIMRRYETARELVKAALCAVPNAVLKKKFAKFTYEQCEISEPIMPGNLKKALVQYDIVVVGSDQIWNSELTGGDENYFLPFQSSCKKIAYAASFGSFDDEKLIKYYFEKDISDFTAVSLREMDTVKYLDNAEKYKIQQVLDPTFLLNREDWKNTFIKSRLIQDKYILVYKMMDAEGLFEFARKLGKEKGLPIIYITHSARRKIGMKNIFTASPEEFLNYMYYAEYVVTSSFHGTALSVNLNKEFYYALDTKKITANRRIEALMNLLNLQNRNIAVIEEDAISIDWDLVNQKLDEQRIHSKEFLKKAIEEGQESVGAN